MVMILPMYCLCYETSPCNGKLHGVCVLSDLKVANVKERVNQITLEKF